MLRFFNNVIMRFLCAIALVAYLLLSSDKNEENIALSVRAYGVVAVLVCAGALK